MAQSLESLKAEALAKELSKEVLEILEQYQKWRKSVGAEITTEDQFDEQSRRLNLMQDQLKEFLEKHDQKTKVKP